MQNIDVTDYFLSSAKKIFDFGSESYIYKASDKSLYKIFKTDNKEVLENKLVKLIKLEKLGIDFFTNPVATLSCNHEFVGYKMNYDINDVQWFNTFLTDDKRIDYLKDIKEKLLVLEEYGILYSDIKDDNFLINQKNGKLKFCDIDNVQIDELKVDVYQNTSSLLKSRDSLFDNSIHAFMHNLYTLEQLEGMSFYEISCLCELCEKRVFASFNDNQKEIIDNMVRVKKKEISGRYLIDNLK